MGGERLPQLDGAVPDGEERLRGARSGPRGELRYERLLADTAGELGPLRDWLGLAAERQRVETIAERHSFDSVPERLKGPGKHYRAARPGGWRTSLSEEEKEVAGRILEPALTELGYEA